MKRRKLARLQKLTCNGSPLTGPQLVNALSAHQVECAQNRLHLAYTPGSIKRIEPSTTKGYWNECIRTGTPNLFVRIG